MRTPTALGLSLATLASCGLPDHQRAGESVHRAPNQPRTTRAAPAVRRPPSAATGSHDASIRGLVRTRTIERVSFTEENGGYVEVVELLRVVSDLPIVITPGARQVIADQNLTLEAELGPPIPIASVLDLMTSASADLAWTVRNGVVEITDAAEARGAGVLVTHDVRDLVFPRTEFLPPRIDGIPTGDSTERRSGHEADEKIAAVAPDELVETLRLATGPGYWDAEGGGTIEYADSGYLLIRATPRMQRAVARVLDGLR